MIIYTHQKSKKKSKTKKEIAEYQNWLDSVQQLRTNFSRAPSKLIKKQVINTKIPPGRESPKYPSLNNGIDSDSATKPITGKIYTGTAMKGIGTLHKSNAVPVFSDEEMIDQANMRR